MNSPLVSLGGQKTRIKNEKETQGGDEEDKDRPTGSSTKNTVPRGSSPARNVDVN
jgi:hypothetical protein